MVLRASLFVSGMQGEARVHAVRGHEAISEPYLYEIDFSCEIVDPDEAIGKGAVLEITGEFDGHSRFVTGMVEDLELLVLPLEARGSWPRHRITLRSKPHLGLAYRRGYRIFQEMTVVDIVKAIFTDADLSEDLFAWDVAESYQPRTYTVQYDESEWDFVCRLLAEEGIYYAFEHGPDGHVMRLMDAKEQHPKLEPFDVEYLEDPRLSDSKIGAWHWMTHAAVSVTKVSLNDYDMTKPSTSLLTDPPKEAEDVISREHYEFPGYYVGDYDPMDEGNRRAQVRLDALRVGRRISSATTNALGLNAGMKFQLVGHDVAHGEHVVIAADVHIRLEAIQEGLLGDGGQPIVEHRIRTIPADQQYRAPSLPKPKAIGCTTAKVTGPSGEEIHCDEYGRIKVQFHWDRDGQLDEHTTCFIRVAQPHTTGSFMVPRIGWEVFVEFQDGDPDRPLVMGRVWNPFSACYYELPNDKNLTAHASMSSPGGDGLNEILLDDNAGAERIAITAKHNVKLVAANNRTFSSGNHHQHNVTGNRAADVGGDEKSSISANLGANVTSDLTVDIGANRETKASGSVACEVTGSFDLTCSTEMIKVGNPMAAVLEVIAAEAIEAATGAIAGAASRGAAAVLGPITPALGRAGAVLGTAAQLAGPAAALFAPNNPTVQGIAQMAGGIADGGAAALGGAIAGEMMNNQLAGAAAKSITDAARGAGGGGPSGGGGGGGGGGAGGSAGAQSNAAGASGGGNGEWRTTVGGAVTEDIGGAAILTTARGFALTIGGGNTETVGAARIELINGGKNEVTGAAKAEQVGVYMVKAGTSVAISAKAAIALNIAGSSKTNCGGSYAWAASGPVVVNSPKLKVKAAQITISSGGCKLILKGGNIVIEGKAKLEIQGTTKLDPNVLGAP